MCLASRISSNLQGAYVHFILLLGSQRKKFIIFILTTGIDTENPGDKVSTIKLFFYGVLAKIGSADFLDMNYHFESANYVYFCIGQYILIITDAETHLFSHLCVI